MQKISSKNELKVLILAAGLGKRMVSNKPKVLHELLYRPMLHWVVEAVKELQPKEIGIITGFQSDEVKKSCADFSNLKFFIQADQLGTGHAVLQAKDWIAESKANILIVAGDTPALRTQTLSELVETHSEKKSALTLLSAIVNDPTGYGRIVKKQNRIIGILEEKDCSKKSEKNIKEVNTGVYCFDGEALLDALSKISNKNAQKEYYLTDTIEILVKAKKNVTCKTLETFEEVQGINDRKQLSDVQETLQKRINENWMRRGVTLQNPTQTWICPKSMIAPDVTLEANCVVIESKIGKGTYLKQGTRVEKSQIGEYSTLGPYAHLRPGSKIGNHCKIGDFVETKASVLADEVKASHLSYIGDAEIGARTNIGCGFITCNFDGVHKHKTQVGEDVFIGSDSQIVAPVTIGRRSYIASGTTVTENVPDESLVISRGKQVTKPGYAKKYGEEK